jgi:hypothetical protein
VKRANGMILQGLKRSIIDKLNKSGRIWLQELSSVIWSLRTTPSRATGFTLFFLVYGERPYSPRTWNTDRPRSRAMTKAQTSELVKTRWIR